MDAIKFITNEHNRIRRTFALITKKTREDTKVKMFNLLCKDLTRHETMEQKVWYPFLKKNKNLNTTIKHLVKEEKTAAKMIKEFKKIKSDVTWETKFLKFKADVSHHANEEETKLFPKVRLKVEKDDLNEIGKKLRTFKNKYNNHYL